MICFQQLHASRAFVIYFHEILTKEDIFLLRNKQNQKHKK